MFLSMKKYHVYGKISDSNEILMKSGIKIVYTGFSMIHCIPVINILNFLKDGSFKNAFFMTLFSAILIKLMVLNFNISLIYNVLQISIFFLFYYFVGNIGNTLHEMFFIKKGYILLYEVVEKNKFKAMKCFCKKISESDILKISI